jgi:TPR repeat protein
MFCLAFMFAGAANADELADASQALQQKNYPVALKLFTKLASANNSEAQLRLGEMYWYGEGVALDRAKADKLFAQAAASGNPGAISATRLSSERVARSAEIAYWTGGYTGADLRSGKFDCKAPVIPARSTVNAEITQISADISTWTTCYNNFVANMASLMPAGKAIPAEVLEVMSEQELAQARLHLDGVYKSVVAAAKADAGPFIVQRDSWQAATAEYVKVENGLTEQRTAAIKRELELATRNRDLAKTLGTTRPRIAPTR